MILLNLNKKSDYFIAFSISLMIFFHQYWSFIPGITLCELLLGVSVFLVLMRTKMEVSLYYTKGILIYYMVGMSLLLVSLFLQGLEFPVVNGLKITSRWIRYFGYVFFCIIIVDNLSLKETLLKVYRFACIIICIYTLMQTIGFFLFGVILPIKILPFSEASAMNYDILIDNFETGYFRAYGPFTEPSYLTKFLCPGFCFSLYGWCKKNQKVELFTAILISLTIMISTSSQGISLLVLTIMLFALSKRFLSLKNIGILIIVVSLALVLWNTGVISRPLERLTSISLTSSGDYSSELRLFRGYAYWLKMPFVYKFIGAGFGNIGNFTELFNITTPFDHYIKSLTASEYMNGIAGILVETGLIGFFVFVVFVVVSFKRLDSVGKILLGQLLLLLGSGTMLLSPTSVFYFAMIFLNAKKSYAGRGE